MIGKAVLTTTLALGLYTALIFLGQDYIHRTAQTVEQRNIVKAEEFLYEAANQYDTLMVGSSMSDRLTLDKLPGRSYNLSLGGLTALDGLRLIAAGNHAPKLLYVETNTLDRDEESQTIRDALDPTWRTVKQYVPFVRRKYQPFGVLKAVLRDWANGTGEKAAPEAAMVIDPVMLQKAITERTPEMNQSLDDAALRRAMLTTKRYLDDLRQRGTQVVLFEMPIEPRFQNSPRVAKVRQAVAASFPASDYGHVALPTDDYHTTDGVHLTQPECVRYTVYLREQLFQ